LDYEISGRENIGSGQSYLILANHPSLIDVIFLFSLFPEANCIVKAAMVRNPLFFALMRSAGYISNEDPVAMLLHATESLQAGESLILFPEGTRTRSGCQPEFSAGAAAIAVRAGSQCLPIFISCTPTTLTSQDKWYQVPERRVKFVAAIQPALDPLASLELGTDMRDKTTRVNNHLQDYFVTGLGAWQEPDSQLPTG
jgi:1-acyl-sn-glycerol-3-phosphate acyltransferase